MRRLRFGPAVPRLRAFTAADGVILVGLIALLGLGLRLGIHAPAAVQGPEISLQPRALPWYAAQSIGRMAWAYAFSLLFSLFYGYAAARSRRARIVLMPLLDVLQSVPILSFLPVVLLGLTAVLPDRFAAELAAVLLIFTSQAWNMTFSFYQSLRTIPTELREASAVYRFSPWLQLKYLELPFAALGLIWNSIMSWAGGWFFLMASETFRVGPRDFRLPGLGSYLQAAASRGDIRAVLLGVGVLVLIVVLLDQLVWRPLLARADRFKVEMLEGGTAPASWFNEILARSAVLEQFAERVWGPFSEWLDARLRRRAAVAVAGLDEAGGPERFSVAVIVLATVVAAAVAYGAYHAGLLLARVAPAEWGAVGTGLLATCGRVAAALALALLWTVPVGVAIGTNPRLAAFLQPLAQILAAIPATALFPVVLLALLHLPGGLNLAAVLLMLMGTQWYLLFNIIAGAAAIPTDLRYTTDLLRLPRGQRWRTLVLPALFPYIVTGLITSGGGAWNASIVAEYVEFGGRSHFTVGIGSVIARATAAGNYSLLLAGTLALVATVIGINRAFWHRLYRLAETRYRME
jgi:NitT/TauT family transport system permease protein